MNLDASFSKKNNTKGIVINIVAVADNDEATPWATDVAIVTASELILEVFKLLFIYSITTCIYALSEYVSKYSLTISIYLGIDVINVCVCSTIIGTMPIITTSITTIPTNIASRLLANLGIFFENKLTKGFKI